MPTNADVIRSFYAAFQRRDHAAMAACYAPDATFSDPVFRDLQGPRVAAMWRMLCERATDLRIEASDIEAEGDRGSARWEAWYTFSATGRPVHNIIRASFEFRDGLIRPPRRMPSTSRRGPARRSGSRDCSSAGRRWCRTPSGRRRRAGSTRSSGNTRRPDPQREVR